MKYIFLTIIAFILSFQISNSQWVQVSNGIGNLCIYSVVANGNTLFAGTPLNGVFQSIDYGANWTQTSLNTGICCLEVNGSNIFAGTINSGVFISTNNGINWTQTTLNDKEILAINVNGIYINAATNSRGIYLSTNNGVNWSHNLGFSVVDAFVRKENNMFSGIYFTNSGVYVSSNNGVSWYPTGLLNHQVQTLIVIGNNVLAGTNLEGIYISTNDGGNWTQTSLSNKSIYSLERNGNTLFAGTNDNNGVFVSNDTGKNWTQRNEGLCDLSVLDFCIVNNFIYAGTGTNGVFKRPLSELIGITSISNEIPASFSLSQNYPNPFNPSTNITFDVPLSKGGVRGLFVKLIIYDITGRQIQTLVKEELKAGTYKVDFDGAGFASGIYFYSLSANDPSTGSGQSFTETKKMLLVK